MYVQMKRTMVGICIGAMLMTVVPAAAATPRVLSEGESLGTKLLQQGGERIIGIIVYFWEQAKKQPPPLPQPSIRTVDVHMQWLLVLYRAYETCKKTKNKCGIKPNVTVINSVQNAGKALLKKYNSRCSDIAKTKVTIQNIAPFAYAIMHCQSMNSANLSEKGNAKPSSENNNNSSQRKNKGGRGYVFKCTEAYEHNYDAHNQQMMQSKVWMYEHFARLNEAEKILRTQITQITGTTKNDKTKKNALLNALKKINEEKQALRKHLMLLECDISFRKNGRGMPGSDPQADIINTINHSQYKPEKPLDKTDRYPFQRLYEKYKLKDHDFNTF